MLDSSSPDNMTNSISPPPGISKKEYPKTFQQPKTAAVFPAPIAINPEIKKQLEMLRIAKEQAESKVSNSIIDIDPEANVATYSYY